MSENQAKEATIQLTMDSESIEEKPSFVKEVEEEKPSVAVEQIQIPNDLHEENLSTSEKEQVETFAKQIDITKSSNIIQYGAAAQKKIANFSDTALANVQTKDLGEVGETLNALVNELKGFEDKEEEKGFFGFFKKAGNNIGKMKTKYDSAEKNVDKIVDVLQDHQVTLLKDISLLDQLYERNQVNTKELTMYILAGYKRLQAIQKDELTKLKEKAIASGSQEDAQALNDLVNMVDRFEKKLHDLELTRMVSIQMGPQIRLIQNNDTIMTEKIQSTLVNTIPLWKSQIVLALGINHSKEAMQAQKEVSQMTNQLLKSNAKTLHMASVEIAKESERGVVDIETLEQTNKELIASLDDVLKIQNEGRAKRMEAEAKLTSIENELKAKLLHLNIENSRNESK